MQQKLTFETSSPPSVVESFGTPASEPIMPSQDGMPMAPQAYTVSQVTAYLQNLLDTDPVLGDSVTVQGELSNVHRSSRGHVYFTLKDEGACLKGVIWAGMAKTLSFELEDGLEVYVTGHLEIYAPSGTYSLVTRKIEPVGVGSLQLAFQQLKERLETEGLFSPEFKQPLPQYPQRIGIITSRTGSVIHDMLRVIRRKNPLVDVLLLPVKVQGAGAAEEIAAAIAELNHPAHALDVLIVARGGGSYEDLFCFSEEPVPRAIFHSRLPVITGIGHEPDFSLADAVADYSASTPTAAAEKAVFDVEQVTLNLAQRHHALVEGLQTRLLLFEQQFDHKATSLVDTHRALLEKAGNELARRQERLVLESQRVMQSHEQHLAKAAAELHAFSPLATLGRGYAIATKADGSVIASIRQAQPGVRFTLTLSDGQRHCEVLDS